MADVHSRDIDREEKTRRFLKKCVWLFIILLFSEGAMRKWFFPSLSNIIFIVRDPVVILMYIMAIRGRLFPESWFVRSALFFSFIFLFLHMFPPHGSFLVTLFGIRTNFLYIPLMFLIPKIFDRKDVERVGQFFMLLAIPMALLMVIQFLSPPDSFVNAAVGGGRQLSAGLKGVVRPAGIFAFNTAVGKYLSMTVAFILYAMSQKGLVSVLMLLFAGPSVVVSLLSSGSRNNLLQALIVFVGGLAVLLKKQNLIFLIVLLVIVGSVSIWLVSEKDFAQQGISSFESRFFGSQGITDPDMRKKLFKRGIIDRYYYGLFVEPFENLFSLPAFGYGIGYGTNAASYFLSGRVRFTLAEGELRRVMMEMGWFLGPIYVFYRWILAIFILVTSIKEVKRRNVLPFFLALSCFLGIMNGQWGPSDILGFTILAGGLSLAACNVPEREVKTI